MLAFLTAEQVHAWKDAVLGYMPTLARALAVLIAFWILLVVARAVLSRALTRANVRSGARKMFIRFLKYAILILALLTVADQFGVDITVLVAGLGIAGLAISFAAQDTISNIISGIALVVDQPFKEGDWINIGGRNAHVTDMRLRTTVLTTFDNETIVMPNTMLTTTEIVNYTLTPRIRVRVPIGIAYKESAAEARDILLGLVRGDERVLDDPEPQVVVTELAASSVNLELRIWTEDPMLQYPLKFEYLEKGKRALDEADIEIPFPHQQLFLERSDGLSELARACSGTADTA